jgi:hypothetical protein
MIAFWWLAILTGFIGLLVIGGLIFEVGKSAMVKRTEWLERAKRDMGEKP